MKIARPPGGFHIRVLAAAQTTLDGVRPQFPRLDAIWDGICERLKFTAHREGQELPGGGVVMQFPGNAAFGVPKIAVCYTVLGDQVTITRLLIQLEPED